RARGVVVALEPLLRINARRRGAGEQLVGRRPPVVMVAHGVAARTQAPADADVGYMLPIRRDGMLPVRELRLARHARVRGVREAELGAVVPLLEVKRYPRVLEHAAQEGEVRLAVLDTVFPLPRRRGDPRLRRDPPLGQQLPRDVELGHLLEDTVIAPL